MARQRLLTDEQWAGLLALPNEERDIVRHCTLGPDELAVLAAKRAPHNRLGYALLLCAMRHPGRLLDPGEIPPPPMLAYVARQVGAEPSDLRVYGGRGQTRREQIADLMRRHGLCVFGRAEARIMLAWLTPVAQINRKPIHLVSVLLDELRRRRILLPPPLVLERLVHHARIQAERITYRALTDGMEAEQIMALDGILAAGADGGPSQMAWLRQASASPASKNLLGLIERIKTVRTLPVDRNREAAIPAAAFDALAAEGLRITAQHLRDLVQPRRGATLVAAVIRLETELTDSALLMFDKLMGGLFRKAERRTTSKTADVLRDALGQLRLLVQASRAVIAAHEHDADPVAAVEQAVGWVPFLGAVAKAETLARPETVDVRTELVQRWPSLRPFAPALLDAFAFEGAPAAANLLKAVTLLREINHAGKRSLPKAAPVGFIRRGWRPFVLDETGTPDRRAWEVCVLSELRDRLRAGDVWVRGSRRYRNFEACLLPKPSFAALRAEGPFRLASPMMWQAILLPGRRHWPPSWPMSRLRPKPARCRMRRWWMAS